MLGLSTADGLKIYNLSAGKTLPEWLSEKKKAQLKKDAEFKRRIELIQDFDFSVSSQRLRLTPDGRYIGAIGVYPPAFKVFETSQLSLKFERHISCEAIQFRFIGEDYGKVVMMHADRTIEFHAQYGYHFKTRIPKVGRDFIFQPLTAELYMCGSSQYIFRLSLDEGRFMKPIVTNVSALNCSALNNQNYLMAFGGENGLVHCYDPRNNEKVGTLNVGSYLKDSSTEITALSFCDDGLTLGVGTSNGYAMLYDIRLARPFTETQHRNELPIKAIAFHESDKTRAISCDSKVVKIWDKTSGKLFAAIEGSAPFNDICTVPHTGLLMFPAETKRIQTFYIPSLGPAPKWCSFIDNITEELEEEAPSIYTDYKFVTQDELEQLGLTKMLGTEYVRAYMHGYFVNARLYSKVKSISDPEAFEKFRKESIQRKIEAKKVNKIHSYSRQKSKQEDETTKNNEQKSKRDSRFDAIYTDPDFATAKVDEEAEEKEDEKFLEQYDNVDDGSEDMEEEEEEMEGRKPRMYEQTVSL